MAGTLYLVATPIGTLADITLRALETLKSVDLIASEDTRHSGILLSHYGIATQQVPYHDHNKVHMAPQLAGRLLEGKNIALITDAGTPGIADPAFYLVRLCLQKGVPVTALPGPCAAITALVVSGLPVDRFVFENFVPAKEGRRHALLESLKEETRTIVVYESPHRLLRLLEAMRDAYGNIPVVVARELTKKFEEVLRKPVNGLIEHFTAHPPKGEFVVLWNLKYENTCPAAESKEIG